MSRTPDTCTACGEPAGLPVLSFMVMWPPAPGSLPGERMVEYVTLCSVGCAERTFANWRERLDG